jgi:hypothetical protein
MEESHLWRRVLVAKFGMDGVLKGFGERMVVVFGRELWLVWGLGFGFVSTDGVGIFLCGIGSFVVIGILLLFVTLMIGRLRKSCLSFRFFISFVFNVDGLAEI